MGDFMKSLLRKIQDLIEANFASRRHLMPFGQDGIIRLELRTYHGPTVTLPRGPITKGTQIADIHLDSHKILTLFQEHSTGVKERIRLFRDVRDGFSNMALWLGNDPKGQAVKAISSMTLLEDELKHFGFVLTPLPFWPFITYGIYMQYLNYLYRPKAKKAQLERSKLRLTRKGGVLTRYIPKRAWMRREDFIDKYGPRGG